MTALAPAELAGHAQFFAAAYRETDDESQILLIDPELGRVLCVARLDGTALAADKHALERGEWSKVGRLCWHAQSRTLWAAGGFGVATIVPVDGV